MKFELKTSLLKRSISSFAVLVMFVALSACQSAVNSGASSSSERGASQKAGQRAGDQSDTNTTAPEVIDTTPVDTGSVNTTPVNTGSSSADGVVYDENGVVMGHMVNGEFVADPNYVPGSSAASSANSTDLLSQTIVFFDFDQSTIKPEFRAVLAAHAEYIAQNPGLSLRLEGHADERGSREYNIGLGERRAQAVKRALLLNGVSTANLNTISYGEEKPMVQGSSDSSWAQNRRVELVYR